MSTATPTVPSGTRAERALAKFHDEEDLERIYDLRLIARLVPYVRPHAALLFRSLGLLVVMSCLGLVRPLIMRAALEGFQRPGGAERIVQYGFALAGAIFSEQLLAFPQLVWMQTAGARGMADLRLAIFRFLHTRSLGFFDRRPIGRLVTRVTSDVDSIAEMFGSGALNAVGDLLRLVAIVTIMLTLDWRMSLFAFALVPPIALFVNVTRARMRTAYRQVRSKTARMNAYLNEQVSGIAVVQAYAREQRSQAEFDVISSDYRAANMRAIVVESSVDAVIEMVSSVCIASILWYAGRRARAAGFDVPAVEFGTLFAFIAYVDMFFGPIRDLSARYTLVQSAVQSESSSCSTPPKTTRARMPPRVTPVKVGPRARRRPSNSRESRSPTSPVRPYFTGSPSLRAAAKPLRSSVPRVPERARSRPCCYGSTRRKKARSGSSGNR